MTSSEYSPSVFTKHADGRVTVDQWPPLQLITPEFIGMHGGRFFTAIVVFTLDNSRAVYKVIDWDSNKRCLVCEKVAEGEQCASLNLVPAGPA